ncbi:bacteriocin-protection protein, YdeI/OmpD-associated family [Chitinophaga polysaccharea]|uniref:YdeI/OmpD-associated family protein n=1 Tax=Chitinophaga TaxID=79328 RepID=UPI0014558BDC|nr:MULTISPECIES: YdeI/OmpD-associated family protein [Chitinophaga]NLR59307.1 bacteriocin-protection protein, YdeI/OmpD-associated family [Chitinophaga polysaccharea]NLU91925.1 bacteriocin-protection protein, YdeI/OmpD-associated family [Chitinophaga sp. Ak27]
MTTPKESPILTFQTQEQWAHWLEQHHADTDGAWLRIFKKNTQTPSINYAQALDEALCYGWIDGIKKALDDVSFIQKFTPRRTKSIWSQRNTQHIERLTTAGKMKPAGQREVEKAKADGRWESAYATSKEAAIPEDFMAALKKNKKAKAFFDTLNKQNLFAIYFRLQTAKKPETRAKRIVTIIDMLSRQEKFH